MALTQVPPALLTSTTGTGSTVVLSASPTFTGTVTTPSVTFSDSSTQTAAASPYVLKNRIINGDMRIDQRNAGASVTPSATSYNVDRWKYEISQASKFTIQQNKGSVTPPAGFTNYLGFTTSTAYTVGSGDYFLCEQYIEGFNTADLAWGTANAKTITLSFWVYSSLTGTFGGNLQNGANVRFYPFSYTISSANTWEQKTITIVGDTTGTWSTNNDTGILVRFNLGMGSTYLGTTGSWTSSVFLGPTGQTNVVGTLNANWYITGVQLEIGTTATPFERRLYGQELINCQRYYQKLGSFGSVNAALASGVNYNTTTSILYCKFTTTMRAAPTGSVTTLGNFGILSGGVQLTCTSLTPYTMGTDSTRIDTLVASGLTTGQAAVLYCASTTDGIQLNAEL
jgi:hypothetical protein